MRVLLVSLSTYAAPFNDGKIEELGSRLEGLTVVAGNVATLWGENHTARSGPGYEVKVLPLRLARTNATAQLVGLDDVVSNARPDLVHVECEPWQAVAMQSLRIARRLRVPIGLQFAENGPLLRGVGGLLRRGRGGWMLRRCDYAVGWSSTSAQVAKRLAPDIRIETFPATGVSPQSVPAASTQRWFGTVDEALPKVAFVGRFRPEKGIRDFLDACDALARRTPVQVAIAGGDGEVDMVQRWADGRPWAHFHGLLERTEVTSLLAAADVLVCPSRTTRSAEEQFGKAAVEAMSVGTPVFAYDCGALREVIGEGGRVVTEGDLDRLVDELCQYLAAPRKEVDRLPQRAREQATRFSDTALADKLIDLWSSYSVTSA